MIAPRELFFEEGCVAQSCRHQEKSDLRQGQQRHLPGYAALTVSVVMEFVHDDFLEVSKSPLPERDVRQNLGSATQDRRVAVYGGVTRAEPDVVRPKLPAEVHPLFIHKRLDRARIN